MWLHEKLGLLEPPQNIARYKAKNYRTRRLHLILEDVQGWLSIFSDILIRWTSPWWRLQHVTLHFYTHYIPVAGLYFSTFYNPAWLCRQYGQKQLIPELAYKFEPGPLT